MDEKQLLTIKTERLILRSYTLDDAQELQKLIGDYAIADTTARIPHPYTDSMAEEFISRHLKSFEKDRGIHFAITHQEQGLFMGGISLKIEKEHERGELGYWIGKPYWNHGYCTEAAKAVVKCGFEMLGLNRISSKHFTRNPPSGRVMRKIGMKHEGTLVQHFKKWEQFENQECYGLLRSEYNEAK